MVELLWRYSVSFCRLPLAACRLPLAACRLPLAAKAHGPMLPGYPKIDSGVEKFKKFWRRYLDSDTYAAAVSGQGAALLLETLKTPDSAVCDGNRVVLANLAYYYENTRIASASVGI